MDLKALYKRFRAWQLEPVTFKCSSAESHECNNCGNSFVGDYCPVCGQKWDVGKPGWGSLLNDFKLFRGGVGVGGALSFLLQMLLRPGYLISDYLNGRRRMASEPISVLCFVVVFALLILNLIGGGSAESTIPSSWENTLVGAVYKWMSSHLQWAIIIETALLVFPTWLLFRFAPKHQRHTLPEGVYIQFFMCTLVLLCIVLRALVSDWMVLFIPVYYCIAYKQLFGYGIWGTIWRTVLCIGIIFYFFGVTAMVSTHISGDFRQEHTTFEFLSMFGAFLLLGALILLLGYRISKKTAQKRQSSFS